MSDSAHIATVPKGALQEAFEAGFKNALRYFPRGASSSGFGIVEKSTADALYETRYKGKLDE